MGWAGVSGCAVSDLIVTVKLEREGPEVAVNGPLDIFFSYMISFQTKSSDNHLDGYTCLVIR